MLVEGVRAICWHRCGERCPGNAAWVRLVADTWIYDNRLPIDDGGATCVDGVKIVPFRIPDGLAQVGPVYEVF